MAGPANPAAPKGGFNKLFVMVPVMLAARKLDAEAILTDKGMEIFDKDWESVNETVKHLGA